MRQGSTVFNTTPHTAGDSLVIDILCQPPYPSSVHLLDRLSRRIFTMQLVGFLFLGFTLASARNIAFKTCDEHAMVGNVIAVDVSPCSSEPCQIPKGGSVNITIRCKPNVNAEKLRLNVYAEVANIEVPYPGMKRDACKDKNITCPITKDEEITMVQVFPIKKFFPSIKTRTRFNLKTNDDQDKNICCFIAPVEVVDSIK